MAPDDTATDPSSPPPGPPPGPAAPRLTRSRTDRVVGGVAGGLGRYFGVDPILFRVAFVALTIAGGAGVAAYGAAWLLLPEEGDDESIAAGALRGYRAGEPDERRHSLIAIGVVALICIVVADSIRFDHWGGGLLFPLGLIVVVVLLLSRRGQGPGHGHVRPSRPPVWPSSPTAPTPPMAPPADPTVFASDPNASDPTADPYEPFAPYPPYPDHPDDPAPPAARYARQPSLAGFLLGGLAVVGGVIAIMNVVGLFHVSLRGFLGAALIATGAALLLSIWRGGTRALVAVGLVLAAALGITSLTNRPLHGGIGDRTWQPANADELRHDYRLGVGDLTVDLRNVHFTEGTKRVNASLGVGDLEVLVPDNVEVRVTGRSGAGQVDLLGYEHHGVNVEQATRQPGPTDNAPVLVLDARVGVGHIDVERAAA